MGQVAITTRVEKVSLTKREQLILLEIGNDAIDSASAFVGYLSEEYGFSKSSVWYNLNRLKEKGILSFASKDEPGIPLVLTRKGIDHLHALISVGMRVEDFAEMPAVAPNLSIKGRAPLMVPNIMIG